MRVISDLWTFWGSYVVCRSTSDSSCQDICLSFCSQPADNTDQLTECLSANGASECTFQTGSVLTYPLHQAMILLNDMCRNFQGSYLPIPLDVLDDDLVTFEVRLPIDLFRDDPDDTTPMNVMAWAHWPVGSMSNCRFNVADYEDSERSAGWRMHEVQEDRHITLRPPDYFIRAARKEAPGFLYIKLTQPVNFQKYADIPNEDTSSIQVFMTPNETITVPLVTPSILQAAWAP
eukprot:Protomagalhaensia_wolfi_Nauph_80__6251@NODE_94_length_3780_cov_395_230152_g71_i0_p3_GENE_NODE_94_length_3780_cov_395_230152_g71_i0NODE_94_length_3780_cov_395_230152_g71_i0_p3_ORF_typecomplete_len233_score32_28_NODE_94_length_3780_cov_395_230152_g71_i016082306